MLNASSTRCKTVANSQKIVLGPCPRLKCFFVRLMSGIFFAIGSISMEYCVDYQHSPDKLSSRITATFLFSVGYLAVH